MNKKSKTWKGLTKRQVIKKVKNYRVEALGGDIFRLIEDINLLKVRDSYFFFLEFNVAVPCKKSKRLERIIGYGNPTLFIILNNDDVHIFIDGTFKVAPHPFYQLLVVMAYDKQSK